MKSFNFQKGQSLLILVLMMSMVLAVLSAVSYRLTTDTQSAQLQDDAVSALAAADSGIEAALKIISSISVFSTKKFNDTSLGLSTSESNINLEKSTVSFFQESGYGFLAPEIKKDSQFTFYLVNPGEIENISLPDAPQAFADIFFKDNVGSCSSSGRTQYALEVSLLLQSNNVNRFLIEPCTANNIGTGVGIVTPVPNEFRKDTTLNKKVSINVTGGKVLIVRSLFNDAKIGFNVSGSPNQGTLIRSTAVTNSGVSRSIEVYRTTPQLPAEFFVTQF